MPEVYKITGYTGDKGKDIDAISSTEDDLPMLSSYFDEAISSLSDVVSRLGYLSEETSTEVSFAFQLPPNWNTNVKPALEKSLKQYIYNHVCMQWFNLSKKEEVKFYQEVCDNLSIAIKKHLLDRKKPIR